MPLYRPALGQASALCISLAWVSAFLHIVLSTAARMLVKRDCSRRLAASAFAMTAFGPCCCSNAY